MIIRIFLFLAILFTVSCSKTEVKEPVHPITDTVSSVSNVVIPMPAGQYYTNYLIFRNNQTNRKKTAYTFSNYQYFNALQSEFDLFTASADKTLKKALTNYQELLTNSLSSIDKAFILQRAGISSFKMKDYKSASLYLNQSFLENFNNAELAYYRAMLTAYHSRNLPLASASLERIRLESTGLDRQAYLFFQGSLYFLQKSTSQAFSYFENALRIDKKAFYLKYDLLPFYLDAGRLNQAADYQKESFAALISLKTAEARIKAFEQAAYLQDYLRSDIFIHQLKLSEIFNYYPSIPFCYQSPSYFDREKSQGMEIPLLERRQSMKDEVYNCFQEDYIDLNDKSYLLLIEGVVSVTNIKSRVQGSRTPTLRLLVSKPNLLLLSPTNQYILITNNTLSSNDRNYIVSNQNNVLFQTNLNFNWLWSVKKFKALKKPGWDYAFFGFNSSNQAACMLFYPDTLRFDSYSFTLTKNNASFVVMDVTNSGTPSAYLLDKDVYLLKK